MQAIKPLELKSPKTVLVVEDNELNLKLFKDILDVSHITTIELRDGRNALDICKNQKPDLVIMDIQLPYISGIDVIKQIKGDAEVRMIPVIAVTAFAMQTDKERILASGCDVYLPKPISIESFVEAVQQFLT